MVINSKLSDEKLLEAIYKAATEYEKLIGNSYLIIGKNKSSDYYWFQCQFEKKYFMHLLGIDSKNLSANEFYERCEAFNKGKGEGVRIEDCTPSRNHNRTTINEKCSCCADILHLQDAKYMKIGSKNKISQYVDFTYCYGSMATLGFRKMWDSSFPLTLIPRNIDEFTSKKYKIAFVLKKTIGDKKYENVFVEIKKGLYALERSNFPEELLDLLANPEGENEAELVG